MTWKVLLKRTAVCAAFAVIGVLALSQYRQEKLVTELSEKIIRFHVLANSDSEEDQRLKLEVRDAVGAYMQTELTGLEGKEDSRRAVQADMDEIVEKAKQVVAREGYHYQVSAALRMVDFPEKTYGNYTFPGGEYEALQIIIGQGKGKNWWCVMYPNMCFSNSVYEVVDEEAEKSLKRVLTAEEYASIMEEGNYKVKFKWLSFLNR